MLLPNIANSGWRQWNDGRGPGSAGHGIKTQHRRDIKAYDGCGFNSKRDRRYITALRCGKAGAQGGSDMKRTAWRDLLKPAASHQKHYAAERTCMMRSGGREFGIDRIRVDMDKVFDRKDTGSAQGKTAAA